MREKILITVKTYPVISKKYLDELAYKRDLYLYVGTTMKHHRTAPNPFVIIGTFTPPKNRTFHPDLFDI